jgi:hypothetical protein
MEKRFPQSTENHNGKSSPIEYWTNSKDNPFVGKGKSKEYYSLRTPEAGLALDP